MAPRFQCPDLWGGKQELPLDLPGGRYRQTMVHIYLTAATVYRAVPVFRNGQPKPPRPTLEAGGLR